MEKNSKELRVGKDSGRVKAFVRIRPFSKNEEIHADGIAFEIEDTTQLKIVAAGHTEKNFVFDHIFTSDKTNEEVCKVMTSPLVKAAMSGFNGTLMAYGQTGAGKTYTLMSDDGIARSLINTVFQQIQDDSKHCYKVTVSYLQIYQEKLFDLLTSDSKGKGELFIRENPRTGIYVENLTEYVVRTPMEVLQFLMMGKKKLVFAETKMNMRSSRSHAVLQMSIERTMKEEKNDNTILEESEEVDGGSQSSLDSFLDQDNYSVDLNTFGKDVIIRGKIHICDLAGSERIKRTGAAGDRLNEAQHINSSLLELGNVIQALADEKATHVPFRNSVLTRLLQESLGGNCKTSLIICCSPSVRDIQETKSTLNFGSRAMKVTNTAYVNMEVNYKSLSDQLLKQLETKEEEIYKIKVQCKHEIERSCEGLRKKIEEVVAETQITEKELRLKYSSEMNKMQNDLHKLQNEITIKNEKMKNLEDSLVLIDDNIKQDKLLFVQFLKILQFHHTQLQTVSLSYLATILQEFVNKVMEKNFSQQKMFDSLCDLQTKLELESDEGDLHLVNFQEILTFSIRTLDFDNILLNSDVVSEDDVHMFCYKGFLSILLQNTKKQAEIKQLERSVSDLKIDSKAISQPSQNNNDDATVELLRHENQSLRKTINSNEDLIKSFKQKNAELSTANAKELTSLMSELERVRRQLELLEISNRFDAVDGKISKAHVGVQVSNESDETSNKMKGRRLIGTTFEDEEKVVTEIQTENVVENPDFIRPSRDIFSGFGSTLGRIEGMMERKASSSRPYDSIASRFGLTSYLSKDPPPRSSSTLGYRSDENFKYTPYKSSYISGLSDPFTPSSRPESPFKSTRSYNAVSDYHSIDRLRTGSPIPNKQSMSYEIRTKERTDSQTNHMQLEEKCTSLENEVRALQKEKNDFLSLLEDLSRVYPNDRRIQSLQDKTRMKPVRIDVITQTEDETRRGRESLKVAHIKPFANDVENQPGHQYISGVNKYSYSSPSVNSFNVSYELHEDDAIRNIAKTQHNIVPLSQSSGSANYSPSSPDYSLYPSSGYSSNSGSPENKQKFHRWIPPVSNRWRENDDNLLDLSSDGDKSPSKSKPNFDYSSSVFSILRDNKREVNRKERKDRPQTWYGSAEDKKIPYAYRSQLAKSNHESAEKALDIPQASKTEEVIFSLNNQRSDRRSSWSLPEWMKTKKREANIKQDVANVVIQ